MKRYKQLYPLICSKDNLYLAYKKARKHKTLKPYVIEFENNLKENLVQLQKELELELYEPRPLETFILRDPKTRKISKSDFRDRIVHHAICNIIEPLFDKTFIHDSYANRKGKGTLKAIKRFEEFKQKASQNNTRNCYILKADIKHYFDNVDHNILITLLQRKIKDKKLINLIRIILSNHQTRNRRKGMPLGNFTSQFFANIYLDELDWFIKHKLRVNYYIRYVDDFVIMDEHLEKLEDYKTQINQFLKENLHLELHPEKTKISFLKRGVGFLGIRIYPHHKLLAKRNSRKFRKKLSLLITKYQNKQIEYDKVYDTIEGWIAHIKHANSYKLRQRILTPYTDILSNNLSTKEYNKYLRDHSKKNIESIKS